MMHVETLLEIARVMERVERNPEADRYSRSAAIRYRVALKESAFALSKRSNRGRVRTNTLELIEEVKAQLPDDFADLSVYDRLELALHIEPSLSGRGLAEVTGAAYATLKNACTRKGYTIVQLRESIMEDSG